MYADVRPATQNAGAKLHRKMVLTNKKITTRNKR